MIGGTVKLDLGPLKYKRGSGLNKATRIALNRAAAPVSAAVKSVAPSDGDGFLRQSIRIRTRYYAKGETWAAIVGPASNFKRTKRKRKAKSSRPSRLRRAAARARKAFSKRAGKLGSKALRSTRAGRRLSTRLRKAAKARAAARPKPPAVAKVRKRKARKSRPRVVRPARYAHLLQWGGGHTRGTHFLERALARSQAGFVSALTSGLRAFFSR